MINIYSGALRFRYIAAGTDQKPEVLLRGVSGSFICRTAQSSIAGMRCCHTSLPSSRGSARRRDRPPCVHSGVNFGAGSTSWPNWCLVIAINLHASGPAAPCAPTTNGMISVLNLGSPGSSSLHFCKKSSYFFHFVSSPAFAAAR